MQVFLPTLRADFAILETYFYASSQPLECPITAFGSSADSKASELELAAWRNQTRGEFALQLFPGDHFFLHSERKPLLAAITAQLSQPVSLA
jgi:surfactin synthase thioesterase subunit